MSSAQALRYLVLARLRNRVRTWVARLRTPMGLLGAGLLVLVLAGFALGGDFAGHRTLAERKAYLGALLGFLLVMGVLSGLGQRGLVFTRADLDFLFPAPIPKRQLLLYYFIPGYAASLLIALVYLVFLGGRSMPSPPLFYVGTLLCLVTNAHLTAFAAEVSMLLADKVHARLRHFTLPVVVLLSLGCILLVVGGMGDTGALPAWVRDAWGSRILQVLFYPALQAVELGAAETTGAALGALLALLACAAGSFALVLLLRVDFLEASFGATRKVRTRMEQARRGVHTARVRGSSRGPRGPWVRGAGAVLWLGALTMRRQVRAVLGGLLVVTIMLAVFTQRGAGGGRPYALLLMLAFIPLWMPLPIGFRLPRDQLQALRLLPLDPTRLAGALLTVPVVVVFLLQALAVAAVVVLGRAPPELALVALPGYLVVNATTVCVESVFVMQRDHPNQVNFVHEILRLMLQMVALGPGVMALAVVHGTTRSVALAAAAGVGVQALVSLALLVWVGRRLQRMDVTNV